MKNEDEILAMPDIDDKNLQNEIASEIKRVGSKQSDIVGIHCLRGIRDCKKIGFKYQWYDEMSELEKDLVTLIMDAKYVPIRGACQIGHEEDDFDKLVNKFCDRCGVSNKLPYLSDFMLNVCNNIYI